MSESGDWIDEACERLGWTRDVLEPYIQVCGLTEADLAEGKREWIDTVLGAMEEDHG